MRFNLPLTPFSLAGLKASLLKHFATHTRHRQLKHTARVNQSRVFKTILG